MPETGLLTSVRWEWDGTETTSDLLTGETDIPVLEAVSLSVDEVVWIGETTYGVVVVDEDSSIVTLATPLVEDIEEGTPVVPDAGGEPGRVWVADVVLPDPDEPLEIPLTIHDIAVMPLGEYDPPRPVTVSDDLTSIVDFPGVSPRVLGSWLDPVGMPNPVPDEKPALSPTPSVFGTAEALIITVDTAQVEPGTTLDYHVSTDPLFSPSSTTLAISTRATIAAVTEVNGMPVVYDQEDPNDPDAPRQRVTYYVRVVAHNAAGAADPSPTVEGMLDPSRLNSVIAAQVAAGFGLFGQITVGQITIDPTTGITIPQPGGGEIHFPADGIEYAVITAHLVAKSLNVEDNLTISGAGQLNGTLDLRSGITRPLAAPTVSSDWPKVLSRAMGDETGTRDNGNVYNGLAPHISDSNLSVTAVSFFGGGIRLFNHQTGVIAAYPDPTHGKAWTTNFSPLGGIATDPVRGVYFLLGSDSSRNGDWYVYAINATTYEKVGEEYWWTMAGVGQAYPRIAYYDNNLYIVWVRGDNAEMLRPYGVSGTSSAITFSTAPSSVQMGSAAGRYSIGGLDVGLMDYGSAHIVYRYADSSYFRVRALSNPSVNTSYNFLSPATKVRGLRWAASGAPLGSRLIVLDVFGWMHYLSELTTDTVVTASQSWYDPKSTTVDWDESGGTGTHETEESVNIAQSLVQARAWLTVTNSPAPDEANNDPTNVDKANASRVYVGLAGAGQSRYLHATLGKSTRTVSVQMAAGSDTATAWNVGINAFTTEDIGATVTGTNIPAGTTIESIQFGTAGQVVTLSNANTSGASYSPTLTVVRSQFGRKMWSRSTLTTGTKTPETVNGFLTAQNDPGLIKSIAEDADGPLVQLVGDGSWRLGPLSGSGGFGAIAHQVLSLTSTISLTGTTSTTLTGLEATVTSHGPDNAWLVTAHLDNQRTNATQTNFIGELKVDGAVQSGQLARTGSTQNDRMNNSQSWLVTGLSAGSHTIAMTARLSGASGWSVNSPHSRMVVMQVA